MKRVTCNCGCTYNPEETRYCPLCGGSSEVPNPEQITGVRIVRMRKRGKAVRGTPLANEIAEMLKHHQTSTVVKMMEDKVKRSTIYNISREEKVKKETLHTLCLMFGIDQKTGQLAREPYTNTEVNDLQLLACEHLFRCLPEVIDFTAKTPIPPWREGYWNMLDMAKRQTGNLPRSMAVF